MSLLRAFILGLTAAAAEIALVVYGGRLSGWTTLALALLPIAVLGLLALFAAGSDRWRARLIRGWLGAFLSAAAGLAAVFILHDGHDWFRWPDERGGDLYLVMLAATAGIPGGITAAAPTPGHGLALAGGFVGGLVAALARNGDPDPGVLILFAIGLALGATMSAFGRR